MAGIFRIWKMGFCWVSVFAAMLGIVTPSGGTGREFRRSSPGALAEPKLGPVSQELLRAGILKVEYTDLRAENCGKCRECDTKRLGRS